MAARGQLQIFFERKNSKTKSEIIQILLSHSPRYGDVQVNFFQVLLKFKMTAMDEFHTFLWSQKHKNWCQK